MDLFTNLTRLKMSMNGGQLPPMTPVTKEAQSIIDPEFTPGMGALEEHMDRGLRCPVRGCGEYHHALGGHIARAHADIGGPNAVKAALDIAKSVALASNKLRSRMRRAAKTRPIEQKLKAVKRATKIRTRSKHWSKERREAAQSTRSIGYRNLQDRCEAQLRHKFIDLENKLGRSPSTKEAAREYGRGFIDYLVKIYGSFNSAKAQFGLAIYKKHDGSRSRREAVLEALQAWHKAHGDLPRVAEVYARDRAPLLPAFTTIQRAFNTNSWPEAMERAASILNIYGGRYGLPESARPKKHNAS